MTQSAQQFLLLGRCLGKFSFCLLLPALPLALRGQLLSFFPLNISLIQINMHSFSIAFYIINLLSTSYVQLFNKYLSLSPYFNKHGTILYLSSSHPLALLWRLKEFPNLKRGLGIEQKDDKGKDTHKW